MTRTGSRRISRREALIGMLLLAFALRLINLDGRSIWYDEAFAILFAAKSFAAMWYGTVTSVQGGAADVHPLLYYAFLHLWMGAVGQTAFAARMLSVVFGVVSVAIMFRVASALFDKRVGMVAALLLAIAPFHIAYSQEARMYAQLGFFSVTAVFSFVRLMQTHLRSWWALFVVSGAGVVYSHNLGFLVLVAVGLWVLAHRDLSLLRDTVLAGMAIIFLWLPWLVLLPSELGKIAQAYWVPRPDAVSLVQTLVSFTTGFDNAKLPPLLLPFSLFVALLVLTVAVYQVLRERNASAAFVLALGLVPPVLLFVVSQWRPLYVTRGLMASFLALLVVAAWGVADMPRWIRLTVGVCAILLATVSLGFYYQYAEFPRSPFREALAFLDTSAAGDDAIVHDNKLSYLPMHYYDPRRVQSFIADPSGSGSDTLALPTQEALGLFASSLAESAQGHSRIWFVIFEEAVRERGGNLDWMSHNYRLEQIERFNDLDVYLYEK